MTAKQKIKITAILVFSILLLSAISAAVLYNVFKISYNTNEIAGIDSEITITRGKTGVPKIETESINGLYFALGYIHAKDRISEMEYLKALATGESELFVSSDSEFLNNLSRTIGFTKNAENILSKLDPAEFNALKSYADGINFIRMKNRIGKTTNNNWSPMDILAILSMKEWANSYLNNTELIFNLTDSKSKIRKNILSDTRYLSYYNEDNTRYLYMLRRIKEIIEKYICSFERGSSIYIPKKYTLNGDSFTTLSFEDSINVYPGWYPVQVILKGESIHALTYSGLPFILSFKNSTIALSQININADCQSFYIFDTENRNGVPNYKISGRWKQFDSTRIPYTEGNEKLSELKWITDKGPIISELINSTKNDSKILVIDSVQPGSEYVKLMLKLPFEKNIDKARNVIQKNDSSLKCFTLSDTSRAYKLYSGFVNQSGHRNQVFVNGSISVKAAARKYTLAKQISGTDFSGSALTSKRELPAISEHVISDLLRIERLTSLTVNKKIYDKDAIKNILTDNYSVAAERFVPLFTSMLENNPLTSSKLSNLYLGDWDFASNSGLQAPAIFYTILAYYIIDSYSDDFGRDADFNFNSLKYLFNELYDQCNSTKPVIFDKPDTVNIESREIIFDRSFLNAMRYLNRKKGPFMENWKWGQINRSKFSTADQGSRIFNLLNRRKRIPQSGGPDTIENLTYNGMLKIITVTSYQSYMDDETLNFKMNFGYSTSLMSDFNYQTSKEYFFDNLNSQPAEFKTRITPH